MLLSVSSQHHGCHDLVFCVLAHGGAGVGRMVVVALSAAVMSESPSLWSTITEEASALQPDAASACGGPATALPPARRICVSIWDELVLIAHF